MPPGPAASLKAATSFGSLSIIENTGDRPATILQYYTKLGPNFIKGEINQKPLFNTI